MNLEHAVLKEPVRRVPPERSEMSKLFEYEDGWIIRDRSFDRESEYTKASAYALGNGYMGNRGTLEEIPAHSGRLVGTYINGIYDAPEGVLNEREFVNVQDWTAMIPFVDGDPLDLATGSVLSFSRWLDLRDAVLHRELRWRSPAGRVITLRTERFLSMTRIHAGFILWELEAEDDCRVTIQSGIDAKVVNIRTENHFAGTRCRHEDDVIYLETITREMAYIVGVACHDSVVVPQCRELRKAVVSNDTTLIANEYQAELAAGDVLSITRAAAIHTSRDAPAHVHEQCRRTLAEARDTPYALAKRGHTERWAELWDQTDMVIEGDEDA